jgi:hypothetical protein
MAEPIDLTGSITEAINGALVRGRPVAWGYIGDDDYPSLSFRGSTQVFSPTQLALWARKRDDGFAIAIAERPQVTALYFEHGGPGPILLSIKGHARVDESANDTVYANMPEGERNQDPEKKGVAIVVDVASVFAYTESGPVTMSA